MYGFWWGGEMREVVHNLVIRRADDNEKLEIVDDSDDPLPEGVLAIDFGEYPMFNLRKGDYIVTAMGVCGLEDAEYAFQVYKEEDGAFIKKLSAL